MSLNRSYVLLRYPEPRSPYDYLNDPTATTKVVQALEKMGVKYFIVLADTLDDYRTIGAAINAAGLQFFSDEKWSWESAIDDHEHFDSAKYLQNRVQSFLIPLKRG